MVTAVRNSPRTAPALPRSGHILSDPRHGPLPPLLLALTAVTGLVDAVSILRLVMAAGASPRARAPAGLLRP